MIWIRSNIFRNFSGCSCPIFECFDIIRFFFLLAFQCHIPNCSTTKTREDIAKRKGKSKTMAGLFYRIWIRSNIFCDFSSCSCPIFKCFDISRFVFLLAFRCCIPNCSTTKTCEATMKIVHPSPVYYLCVRMKLNNRNF